jgi:hypothetical protein
MVNNKNTSREFMCVFVREILRIFGAMGRSKASKALGIEFLFQLSLCDADLGGELV